MKFSSKGHESKILSFPHCGKNDVRLNEELVGASFSLRFASFLSKLTHSPISKGIKQNFFILLEFPEKFG